MDIYLFILFCIRNVNTITMKEPKKPVATSYYYWDKKTNEIWEQDVPYENHPTHILMLSDYVFKQKSEDGKHKIIQFTVDEEDVGIEIEVDFEVELELDEQVEIVEDAVEDEPDNFKVTPEAIEEDTDEVDFLTAPDLGGKEDDIFEPDWYDFDYYHKLADFLQSKKGTTFTISDLTDDNDKFINHVKRMIETKYVNVSFNNDYSKIKVIHDFPAKGIPGEDS